MGSVCALFCSWYTERAYQHFWGPHFHLLSGILLKNRLKSRMRCFLETSFNVVMRNNIDRSCLLFLWYRRNSLARMSDCCDYLFVLLSLLPNILFLLLFIIYLPLFLIISIIMIIILFYYWLMTIPGYFFYFSLIDRYHYLKFIKQNS